VLQQHTRPPPDMPTTPPFIALLILPWMLLSAISSAAGAIDGRPARILSGDSLVLIGNNGRHYTLRLAGIDAPAAQQDGGAAAARQLRMLVLGKPVRVSVIRRGREGTLLCQVFQGGADIGLRLLDTGMARYRPNDLGNAEAAKYRAAVDRARRLGLGIWSTSRL